MAAPLNASSIKLDKYVLVLTGPNNQQLTVARYLRGTEKRALIQFNGIEGPWDGRILDHRIDPGYMKGSYYVTSFDDREWTDLIMQNPDGPERYEAVLPPDRKRFEVKPDLQLAKQRSPEIVLQAYNQQDDPA